MFPKICERKEVNLVFKLDLKSVNSFLNFKHKKVDLTKSINVNLSIFKCVYGCSILVMSSYPNAYFRNKTKICLIWKLIDVIACATKCISSFQHSAICFVFLA